MTKMHPQLPVTLHPWKPAKFKRHTVVLDGVTAWATKWIHLSNDGRYCSIETMETFTTVFLDCRRESIRIKGPDSLALAPALVLAKVLAEAARLAQGLPLEEDPTA